VREVQAQVNGIQKEGEEMTDDQFKHAIEAGKAIVRLTAERDEARAEVARAIAAEREACAKLCEDNGNRERTDAAKYHYADADAIRARGASELHTATVANAPKKHRSLLGAHEICATVRLSNVLEWNKIYSVEALAESLRTGGFRRFKHVGKATLAEAQEVVDAIRARREP
jgi:hypothetical protein